MTYKIVKIKDLYEVHNGLSKGSKFFGKGYPFLSFKTIFNNYFIPNKLDDLVLSTEQERKSYSIELGDIFITRTSETVDELGMSCVALKNYPNATYNGFTKRLRPKTDLVYPKYIGYYLRSSNFRKKFATFSAITTRASLKNEDLINSEIILPSLSEQKRIAKILSTCDDVIFNTQKVIKKYKAVKQGLMQDLFTRGLTEDGNLRPSYKEAPKLYKQSELGVIPKDWEVKTIESLADSKKAYPIVDGPFGSNLKLEHYKKAGIPVIQSGFVTKNKFIADQYVYVDEDKFKQEIRSKVEPGDIVMAKIGAACGTCAILPQNHPIGILAGNSLKISISEENSNYFYEILFHDLYNNNHFDSIILTTAQPAVNMSSLKKMKVIRPRKDEQIKISNTIKALDSLIQKEEAILSKYRKIKDGLMDKLLTN